MMIGGLRHIAWDDPTEAIPAFLTVIIMPLAVSITEGVAFGVIAYVAAEGRRGPRPRGASAAVRVRRAASRAVRSSSGDDADDMTVVMFDRHRSDLEVHGV